MSIAVLISGQMRTVRTCSRSIRAVFPTADIFVHAVLDADAIHAVTLQPRCLVIEPQAEQPERREYTWQLGRGCHGVQRVLKQLDGLRRVWAVYEAHGCTHDWIVRCRADIEFTIPPEPCSTWNGCMFPKWGNFWGLNDRFAILPFAHAKQYFTRYNHLADYIGRRGMFHPETFLAWAMDPLPITRTKTEFATVRPDGTREYPEPDPL